MALQITTDDLNVLSAIAEHRILDVQAIAALCQRNVAALRRRLRRLRGQGLVVTSERGSRFGAGRPGNLVSVGNNGVRALKENGLLGNEIPAERVTAGDIRYVEHQLLLNEFRVRLAQGIEAIPDLAIQFLSSMSPKLYDPVSDRMSISERVQLGENPGNQIEFTPDGVFGIRDEVANKTVIFFLEVDRGTEPKTSTKPGRISIRGKIDAYKSLFSQGGYKRYEQLWSTTLRGFRLLFLTHDASRLASLCRLTAQLAPAEFVWLSDRSSLLTRGALRAIWVKGGNLSNPRESILGSRSPSNSP